jgi:hypothetical protein
MLTSLVSLLALTVSALATKASGTFRSPIATPVFQVEPLTYLPVNVSLPGGGGIAAVPNLGGTITGLFDGEIVGNVTGATETLLPAGTGEYTVRETLTLILILRNHQTLTNLYLCCYSTMKTN